MVITFLLVPLHLQEIFKRCRGKGYRQQLRHFNHKGKYNIGCYPKYIIIFTAYQVQVWWSMILSPVKYQLYGSNVTEIILKISCHIHLKHSKPYMFVLPKLKNPPDGFFTHLFFVSEIILIFGGLFLHRLSRLLKVNINCIMVPTTDFARQKCRTRRDNQNSINPS